MRGFVDSTVHNNRFGGIQGTILIASSYLRTSILFVFYGFNSGSLKSIFPKTSKTEKYLYYPELKKERKQFFLSCGANKFLRCIQEISSSPLSLPLAVNEAHPSLHILVATMSVLSLFTIINKFLLQREGTLASELATISRNPRPCKDIITVNNNLENWIYL